MKTHHSIKTAFQSLLLTICCLTPVHANPTLTPGVVGSMTSIGSETLSSVMTVWATEFNRVYPQAKIQIQTTGSSAAPTAITAGTASIGPMSRPLKPSERQSFMNRFGYEPTMVTVAIDAIGIFVQENNPIESLSLNQLDRLFSATRYCQFEQPIYYWHELLDATEYQETNFAAFPEFPVRLYGRNSASGTYNYFKQKALCDGDYLQTVNQLPSSSSIIQTVTSRVGAIGYASVGSTFSGVKVLSISNGEKAIEINTNTVQSGEYPLTRKLYLLVNQAPDKTLAPGVAQFLRYILSDEGQKIARQSGYFPISNALKQKQLKRLFSASIIDDGKEIKL